MGILGIGEFAGETVGALPVVPVSPNGTVAPARRIAPIDRFATVNCPENTPLRPQDGHPRPSYALAQQPPDSERDPPPPNRGNWQVDSSIFFDMLPPATYMHVTASHARPQEARFSCKPGGSTPGGRSGRGQRLLRGRRRQAASRCGSGPMPSGLLLRQRKRSVWRRSRGGAAIHYSIQ
jgi:hypothetical protein